MGIAILKGVRIFYRESGEGAPVVFVHHLAGNFKSWKEVSIGPDVKAVTYDLRGHGRSSVPIGEYLIQDHSEDLRGLIEFLGIEEPVIVGHSIGTLIALDYALKYPVKKLLLIGALVKAPKPESYERYIEIATSRGMRALAEYRKANGEFSDLLVSNPRAWQDLLEVYEETPPLGYKYTALGLIKARDYTNDLSKIDVPVKLIYGEKDGLIANLDAFKSGLKRVEVRVIPQAGHFLNFEVPEVLSEEINSFIR